MIASSISLSLLSALPIGRLSFGGGTGLISTNSRTLLCRLPYVFPIEEPYGFFPVYQILKSGFNVTTEAAMRPSPSSTSPQIAIGVVAARKFAGSLSNIRYGRRTRVETQEMEPRARTPATENLVRRSSWRPRTRNTGRTPSTMSAAEFRAAAAYERLVRTSRGKHPPGWPRY